MHRVEANGAAIPALGLGTWLLSGNTARRIVAAGIEVGYRHIDTAQGYDNESEVGQGIRDSGLPRDEIFLTTKIWPTNLAPEDLKRTARESLDRLGVEAVDLLLIHWPSKTVPLAESLAALNEVKQSGGARHIGISNFPVRLIEEAVALSSAPLVANQVEYHPYLDQRKVLEACRRHGMALTAYCPIARGRVLDDPVVVRIAERHGRTPAQIVLRWLVQQPGVVAIPKTATPARLKENLEAFAFTLPDADMAALSGLARADGRVVNTAFAPDWD